MVMGVTIPIKSMIVVSMIGSNTSDNGHPCFTADVHTSLKMSMLH